MCRDTSSLSLSYLYDECPIPRKGQRLSERSLVCGTLALTPHPSLPSLWLQSLHTESSCSEWSICLEFPVMGWGVVGVEPCLEFPSEGPRAWLSGRAHAFITWAQSSVLEKQKDAKMEVSKMVLCIKCCLCSISEPSW